MRSDEHNPLDMSRNDAEQQAQVNTNKLKRVQEIEDLKWFMDSVQGRRFVYRLLSIAGTHRTAFRPGQRETDFTLGMQNFGYLIEADLNEACPLMYIRMLNEHNRG